jgi:hypothetical protein
MAENEQNGKPVQKHIPIKGLLAIESKIVLDRLSKAQPGETIPYAELDKLTGCDVRKKRCAIHTPISKLLVEQGMVFICERGVGIRLLHNSEIPSLGQRDITRVSNISRRCIKRLTAVNFESLSSEEKVSHNTALTLLSLFQRGSSNKSMKLVEESVKRQANPLPMAETLKLFGQT